MEGLLTTQRRTKQMNFNNFMSNVSKISVGDFAPKDVVAVLVRAIKDSVKEKRRLLFPNV